jgi:nucleotidyltransferase/DNA polymerase involved in DNA repair
MQTNITSARDKYFWAFAVDKQPPAKRYVPSLKPKKNLHRFLITACSKEAKAFGVRVGMSYDEAKALVPNMRVIVYNR